MMGSYINFDRLSDRFCSLISQYVEFCHFPIQKEDRIFLGAGEVAETANASESTQPS